MRDYPFIRQLLAAWCLAAIAMPGWACMEPPNPERPQCDKAQLQYGMCFNPNMVEAVRMEESPYFEGQLASILVEAQAYLDTLEPASHKVIITDLDETLLSNTGYYRHNKAFHPETWTQWIGSNPEGPYIEPVLAFLQHAQAKGYRLMFITGRPADQALATLHQVRAISWDGIYLRPKGISMTSTQFKTQVRQMLRELGYEIVLTLGDQPSDFGAPIRPAEGEFLLPNVMYSIP